MTASFDGASSAAVAYDRLAIAGLNKVRLELSNREEVRREDIATKNELLEWRGTC
jgi:hypothetical protein